MAAEVVAPDALAEPTPPLGIAFDGDLASRPDALLAVAVLNGLAAKGEARRISLSISRPSLSAARLADVLAEFYPTLPLNAGYSTIGMPDGALPAEDATALASLLASKAPDGSLLYPSNVQRLVDTADNAILIRNMLLAQHDGNASVVLAGRATGLGRMLALNGIRQQLVAKVRQLVVAIGSFGAGGRAEPSVASDVNAARRLFAEWPTPLVAVGAEVGEALRFPGSVLVAGLAGSPVHPVAAAYRALVKQPYDAPSTALAAVFHAVHPEAGYFRISDPGVISVLDDGRTQFTPRPGGTHRYLLADPAQKERLLALYVGLVSAAPAPRPVRRKPPMADAQQAAGLQGPAQQGPAQPTPAQPAPAQPPAQQPPAAASTPAPRGTP